MISNETRWGKVFSRLWFVFFLALPSAHATPKIVVTPRGVLVDGVSLAEVEKKIERSSGYGSLEIAQSLEYYEADPRVAETVEQLFHTYTSRTQAAVQAVFGSEALVSHPEVFGVFQKVLDRMEDSHALEVLLTNPAFAKYPKEASSMVSGLLWSRPNWVDAADVRLVGRNTWLPRSPSARLILRYLLDWHWPEAAGIIAGGPWCSSEIVGSMLWHQIEYLARGGAHVYGARPELTDAQTAFVTSLTYFVEESAMRHHLATVMNGPAFVANARASELLARALIDVADYYDWKEDLIGPRWLAEENWNKLVLALSFRYEAAIPHLETWKALGGRLGKLASSLESALPNRMKGWSPFDPLAVEFAVSPFLSRPGSCLQLLH